MQIPLTLDDLGGTAAYPLEEGPASSEMAEVGRDFLDELLSRIQSIVRRPAAFPPLTPDDTRPTGLTRGGNRS